MAREPTSRPGVPASIVVGVDGREGGWDAIAVARAIAPDAKLTLVTAFGFAAFPPGFVGFNIAAGAIREETVEMLTRAVAERAPGADFQALPSTAAGYALQHAAGETGADLIVVGSSHRGAIGRTLIGDTSRATIHGAPVPVAVAPRGYAERPHQIANVVIGLDGTAESEDALHAGRALAHARGARVRLLAVTAEPTSVASAYAYGVDWNQIVSAERERAQGLIGAALAELEDADGDVVSGRPDEQIAAHAGPDDLIVIGSRGWGPIRRVLLGSTGDRLAHHAPCPVLIVPRPHDAPETPAGVEAREETAVSG